MTNIAINKQIRKIIGNEFDKTYTDKRKNGHRSKFTFLHKPCFDEAYKHLQKVKRFLRKHNINRIAKLHYWNPIGSRYYQTGYTIVTFTK